MHLKEKTNLICTDSHDIPTMTKITLQTVSPNCLKFIKKLTISNTYQTLLLRPTVTTISGKEKTSDMFYLNNCTSPQIQR